MSNSHGSKIRCNECGCKIRGSNHQEGKQHKDRVKVKK